MAIEIEYEFGPEHALTRGADRLGARIVQAWRFGPGKWVVMAQRQHPMHPFAVWVATSNDSCDASFHLSGGDYCSDLPDALQAFQAKAEKHGASALENESTDAKRRAFERRAMRQIKAERAHAADHMLTGEQIEALQAWRGRFGAGWKQRLETAWRNGTDANAHLGHALRQLRNTRGPAWLDRFSLSQAIQRD